MVGTHLNLTNMKKFKIGQKVASAINLNAESVIIENEYFDEYSEIWYFGITYKNVYRYVPQNFLRAI